MNMEANSAESKTNIETDQHASLERYTLYIWEPGK